MNRVAELFRIMALLVLVFSVSSPGQASHALTDPMGGTGGGPINGFLQVSVIHAGSGTPFEGAFVMAGMGPGIPFPDNWGFTPADGIVTFSDSGLQGPITVTVGAEGYRFFTLVAVDAADLVFPLEPIAIFETTNIVGDFVSGIDVNNGFLHAGDGNLDMAFVIQSLTLDDLLTFDMENLIGPYDIMEILGEQFEIPSNIFIPQQWELFIEIIKDQYNLYLPDGDYTLAALSGRIATAELLSGGEIVDLIPLLDWREIDILDVAVTGHVYTADLEVDPDLNETVAINLENIPDNSTAYCFSAGDLDAAHGLGRLIPLGLNAFDCPPGTGPCAGNVTMTTTAATGEFTGMDYFPAVAVSLNSGNDLLVIIDRQSHSQTYTADLTSYYNTLDLGYAAGTFTWNDAENPLSLSPGVDLHLARIRNIVNEDIYWEFLVPGDVLSMTTPLLPPEAPPVPMTGTIYAWEHSAFGLTHDLAFFDFNDFAFFDITGHVSHLAYDSMNIDYLETVSAEMSCVPSSGTLPFPVYIDLTLTNLSAAFSRRIDARISITLAGGQQFPNFKSGHLTIGPDASFTSGFNQMLPAQAPLVGQNIITLIAEDTTPAPFNQPPYLPSGSNDTAPCTVEGSAP